MKKWWRSKTLWFNIFALVTIAVQLIFGSDAVKAWAQVEVPLFAILNIILRFKTDTKVK